MRDIQEYGNSLSISGMVLGNGQEIDIIYFEQPVGKLNTVVPTPDELEKILNQLDVLDITSSQKAVLRKSQRIIDQKIAWKVFKRDSYWCVYCGDDSTPLTVDHLVLWEEGGDSVEANMVSACRKCNHTRGSQPVDQFLSSNYYRRVFNIRSMHTDSIIGMWKEAQKLPLRKTKRSR